MSATTIDRVLDSPNLPSLPTVAVKLLQLTRDPDVELADIADLVQYDPALSAKILKTVNSSYYSLSQPCPNIKRALAYLGLSTVKSLVLGFSLVDLTRHDNGLDLLDYWRRCVYSAAAARRIAMVTGSCDPDEALIAALMQDIGMLAMHAALGDEYGKVLEETNGNHMMVPHCETAALGFNHAEAGARLGERWNLPAQIVDPIRQHHQRNSPFGRQTPLVNAVILAFRISNLVSANDRKPVLDMVSAMSQTIFHLKPEDERTILLETTEDARELSELLDVQVGELPDIEALLVDADDALIRQSSTNGTPAGGSPGAPTAPSDMTDAVTGLANRKHFDQELARLFKHTVRTDGSMGLIMVDADRFKSLSDTVGAKAAEIALQAIARRLHDSLGGSGIVCRTGQQQFGVIVPDASRIDTARMAERARRLVERDHVDLRGSGSEVEAVQVSATFGVAAREPSLVDHLDEPVQLMRLAEQALFVATKSGRNCVRIYKPRVSDSDAA